MSPLSIRPCAAFAWSLTLALLSMHAAPASDRPTSADSPAWTRTYSIDASAEALVAADVQTTSSVLGHSQRLNQTELRASVSYASIAEAYQPDRQFDFLGFSERVHSDFVGGQIVLKHQFDAPIQLNLGGGAYRGYTDFRSLWLSTYFKQQYAVLPDYRAPEPGGFNLTTGARWNYGKGTGFVEGSFLYSRDQIAPGWEMEPATGALFSGREFLHTYAAGLKFENILTPRLRTLHETQVVVTSSREERYLYRGSLNCALGERWVWRWNGGYTHENPTLRAWFVGSWLDYEFAPGWLIGVNGRYYHDTGEIENSLLISSAAPGLETWQVGVGLRWSGTQSSLSLTAAPVWANYEPVNVGTRPFSRLYRDRTWALVQASWNWSF